ncbi:hypothetical protein QBC39DRAFT_377858 [Podospora conica]|nr:hypothetical protein QBC39DRAFT_377858 [Schizothecium conicum]
MDTHDASDLPEIIQRIKEQKRNLQNALLRKGQRPVRQPSWVMIGQFMRCMQRDAQIRLPGHMATSFVPPPYPPCVTPFSELTKAMIGDLVLETQHRGKYLLLRCITPQDRMTAVMSIVEDETMETVMLQLYHQDHPDQPHEEILVQGRTVIVKEPYLKEMASGSYGLRVDHVSDVEFLSLMDERIPGPWRNRPRQNTAATWKETGNEHFNKFRYRAAIEAYTEGLGCSPTDEEREIIARNRSLAHLKIGSFDKALADAEVAALSTTDTEKAPFRKAQALYGLSRFRECCDVLKALCAEHPDNRPAQDLLNRATARLAEETQGQYDFKAMHAEVARLRPPHLDHATFIGPVVIKPSGISSGGRGLFTTAAVAAGDLLFCEKAFAHAFADSSKNVTTLVDVATDTVTMGTQPELIDRLIRKMYQNPSLSKSVTDLYHGDYPAVETASIDGSPIVDSFLLRRIIPLNSFGCPLSSRSDQDTTLTSSSKSKSFYHSCGIWTLASYINHSCDSNTRRAFIGDMMLVRAARDIPADTELTCWYTSPPLDAAAYLERQKTLRKNWGFMCKCGSCREARDTPGSVLQKRKAAWKEAQAMISAERGPVGLGVVRKADKVVARLEETHKRSPREVPRLGVSSWQMNLAARYNACGKLEESVKMALESLRSLGCVVDGGDVRAGGQGPVVREWGVTMDHAVDCWMFLAEAYLLLKIEWVSAAMEYAKTAYRVCFGEDETFGENFGPNCKLGISFP